jgi:hypothetical protein
VLAAVVAAVITAWAEWPSPARVERISATGRADDTTTTARVVVHAGRSDFAWRMARAVASGLAEGGMHTAVATTASPAATPQATDRVVVLVAPTYWWAPAWPVMRATARMRLAREVPVLPIVTASGQGERALGLLRTRAVRSGGTVLDGLALYRLRPNSEAAERGADNTVAAESLAHAAGRQLAQRVHARAP